MRFAPYVVAILMVCLIASLTYAHDKVVVVPLNSAQNLKNVVTVSATGGDFTDPVAAVASITDATAFNPYLVVIGPGLYTLSETLVMKQDVSIAGSGIAATTLKGYISSGSVATSAIVSGASGATLSDMYILNSGGGSNSIAIYNGNSPIIYNIVAEAKGGTENYCIYNDSSSPVMFDISAKANGAGGTNSYGIYNNSADPNMYNVTATASGASATNAGMLNDSTSTPTITNMTLTGTGGTSNYGLSHITTSTVIVKDSTIEGETDGVHMTQGNIRIIRSSVLGGFDSSAGGTVNCVNSDDGLTGEYSFSCTPPDS